MRESTGASFKYWSSKSNLKNSSRDLLYCKKIVCSCKKKKKIIYDTQIGTHKGEDIT